MELRHLRYFLAVAEELHFGRAAERLGIAGPSLSQQIARLERELKVQLFDRDARHVALTPAGEVLLGHASRTLAEQEALVLAMREVAGGGTGTARLGLLLGGAGALSPIITRTFRAAHPNVALEVRELATTELVDPLLAGEIDAEIIWGPLGDPRLDVVALFEQPRVLMVSATNPLADAATVAVHDILTQRHVNQVPGEPDDWEGFYNLVPERNGDQPQRVEAVTNGNVANQLHAIAMSDSALAVPQSLATTHPGQIYGLRYVPVEGLAPITCSIAIRRERPTRAARALRDIALHSASRMLAATSARL